MICCFGEKKQLLLRLLHLSSVTEVLKTLRFKCREPNTINMCTHAGTAGMRMERKDAE